jgi:hypothetical protein
VKVKAVWLARSIAGPLALTVPLFNGAIMARRQAASIPSLKPRTAEAARDLIAHAINSLSDEEQKRLGELLAFPEGRPLNIEALNALPREHRRQRGIGANSKLGILFMPIDHLKAMKADSISKVNHLMEQLVTMGRAVHEAWRKRNRQSSPENIRRNAELCKLRKDNRQLWSLEKLRRKYRFRTTRSVTKILKNSTKWEILGKTLPLGTD